MQFFSPPSAELDLPVVRHGLYAGEGLDPDALGADELAPGWKAFSIAMPAPTTVAPAWRTREMSPCRAAPFARKSSTMSTLSPGPM